MFRKAFTLVEIVIAITISSLLLAGTIAVTSKAVVAISSAKHRGNVQSGMTDVLTRLHSVRNLYPILANVQVHAGYDYLVFTNSGRTSGVLVGIVNAGSGTEDIRLDPPEGYLTYGVKPIAIQDITAFQVRSVLDDPASAYAVPIREESVFRDVVFEEFEATPYNDTLVVDIDAAVYRMPYANLVGRPKAEVPESRLSLNLVL